MKFKFFNSKLEIKKPIPEWEEHWQDMPEYISKDLSAKYQIMVSFKAYEDMKEFSKLINQPLSKKTKSVWYPKEENDIVKHLRYIDENK